MSERLFELGECLITPGARDAMIGEARGIDWVYIVNAQTYLSRHQGGDWGDVCEADKAENDLSVKQDYRILSAYTLNDDYKTKIWIITEADRSVTTILLPTEY